MQTTLNADEGMWTFHNIPSDILRSKYDIQLTDQWLENAKLSSVRFNDGGSGSLVSKNGLVITNHHVAMTQLQKLSSKKNDFVKNGFLSKNKESEIQCPDLEVNILINYENMSERIFKSVENIKSIEEKQKKIKEEIATIEKESTEKTGLRSNIIEFYEGAEYWIYRYKKYTDIRLVMAPELSAAAFGGDSDNFNFPRYALDFAFFRIYENKKPIKNKNFFPFAKKSVIENDLVFVTGHPGSTDRQKTLSQILFDRDYAFPIYLRNLNHKLQALKNFSKQGKEEERQAKDMILGIENSLKAIQGELDSFQDKKIFNELVKKESILRNQILLENKNNDFFEKIENAQNKLILRSKEYFFRSLGSSRLVNLAFKIYRLKQESLKPNEKRYEEFRDSNLESLTFKLQSKAPIYKELEKLNLKTSLELSSLNLDSKDEFILTAFDNQSIEELAENLIENTKIDENEFRESLLKLSFEELQNVEDPLLKWIAKLEPMLRTERDFYENQVESVFLEEGKKISEQKFKIYGKLIYPDATFTLRLSYGTVKNYIDSNSMVIPYKTSFHGLFERNNSFKNENDFALPKSFFKNKKEMNLDSPLNFVSTNDIVGGNSGSPVLNRKGEFVGIIFDGNYHSHVWNYFYTAERGRSISVDVLAIKEVLKKVYKTKNLLDELY